MGIVTNLMIYFLLALALGLCFFSAIVPTKLTGAGLCRVLSGVSLGSIALGSIFLLRENYAFRALQIGGLAGTAVFLCWEILNLKDIKKAPYWVFYGITVLGFSAVSISILTESTLDTFYLLLNALFIGSLSYAMILGHWYLVTPKISEEPLLKAIKWFWLFIGLKLAVAAWSYIANNNLFSADRWMVDYMFNWIVFSMRFLWGYVALLILSVFAWKLTRMRSIQSSTGVLYVMVFFIFVGEVASLYLFFNFGVLT